MAKYSAEQLRQLGAKGHAFKNADGSFSYPIGDAEDLSNAIHAVGRGNASHDALRKYIIGRARGLGKSSMIPENWNSDGSLKTGGRSVTAASPYVRSFALDDISIRAGGDGRTVDAYATVFDQPAEIHDQDGDYEEVNDRAMYNKAVSDAAPAGGRESWRVGVFYNHGMTLYQTPSDLYSMPCGAPLDIRPDSKGLFTSTRYAKGQLGDLIVDGIREGLLTSYSVSGRYLRSDPTVPRDGFRRNRTDGKLPTVRRLEATLREYGPTPFPAYAGAEIVGMRAEWLSMLSSMLRSGTPQEPPDVDTSSDEKAVTDEPPVGHSVRSPKEELQARRAQFIIRRGADNG